MVADLVAAFDDAKAQHHELYSGNSDALVSEANDTITDAATDLADDTTDSDALSTDEVLDKAHPTATTDGHYCPEIDMMHNLTISSSPENNPSIHSSYTDALTAWRTHVTTPFPLVIQYDTITRVARSHEVRPTHVLGYDIDTIHGDGNCFFRAISKEIFATELNHSHLRSAIIGYVGASDALRSSLYAVSSFDDEDAFENDVAEMRKDGTMGQHLGDFRDGHFPANAHRHLYAGGTPVGVVHAQSFPAVTDAAGQRDRDAPHHQVGSHKPEPLRPRRPRGRLPTRAAFVAAQPR